MTPTEQEEAGMAWLRLKGEVCVTESRGARYDGAPSWCFFFVSRVPGLTEEGLAITTRGASSFYKPLEVQDAQKLDNSFQCGVRNVLFTSGATYVYGSTYYQLAGALYANFGKRLNGWWTHWE